MREMLIYNVLIELSEVMWEEVGLMFLNCSGDNFIFNVNN